ncbi:MAG: hypothetical protein ACTSU3_07045 [Candidatus Thorarchaeota archaeon]
MKATHAIDTSRHPVVVKFRMYLNGPKGKTVLENLDEGESFILQTAEHTIRVTKLKGKAVVNLMHPEAEETKPDWCFKAR